MPTCETCGNTYDKTFTIIKDGIELVFDSFECAIHALAPVCEQCGCRILGHGIEAEGKMFCGAHCAKTAGYIEVVDRVDIHAQPGKRTESGLGG